MADRSLLARATEGTSAPTPGYLYLDIAKNVATSPMATQEVALYLTRRLATKNNANVKHKCLKVIAKTAESPVTRGQFKRAISQNTEAIGAVKEALQYRGPPDPARGDEPYQKVRDAAKEALDAIYSDTPSSTMTMSSAAGGGGHHHQGGQSYGGGGGVPGGAARMEGIGNPMFKDPRYEQANGPPTTEEFLREAGSTIVNMIKDPLARNVEPGPPRSSGTMPGYGSGGAYGAPPPGRSQLAHATGGEWTMASNRGPGAVQAPPNMNRDSGYYKQQQAFNWASKSGAASGAVGGSWGAGGGVPGGGVASQARAQPQTSYPASRPFVGMTPSSNPTNAMGQGGTAVSDGQYEKQLIMELCPPGGLKAEPPPDKLQRFAQAIPSLNPDLVCPALLDCVEDGQPWIIRAKALCVMETCITLGVSEDGVNRYADFFFECRGEIEPLARHARPAVAQPAGRVLDLLGIAGGGALPPAAVRSTARAAPPPPAPPAADLLDFGAAEPTPPAEAPPIPPASSSGDGSLFGGLKVQSSKSVEAPPAPAAAGLFDSMNVKTEAPVAAAAPASGFGFMQEPEPAPPVAAAPAGSAFGFMQEQPAAAEAPPAAAVAPPPPAGSAFDFMGGAATDAPAAVPPAAAPATFDPLSNNYKPSPNTQKQLAQLTPAQMQQLYVQQQMRMQFAATMPNMRIAMPQTNPSVMGGGGASRATTSFSFLDVGAQPGGETKKKDESFDFVQDAMKNETKQ